jgi:hypothetical protein
MNSKNKCILNVYIKFYAKITKNKSAMEFAKTQNFKTALLKK